MTDTRFNGPMVTDNDILNSFTNVVASDFLRAMTGEFLGGGVGRGVYTSTLSNKHVIKVETRKGSFQNIMEWEIWDEMRLLPIKYNKWFAPCRSISPCGIVLVQRRTTPIPSGKLPKEMPSFFTDLKPSNFGMLDGRVVAHDYGLTRLISLGLSDRKRKAKWMEE